MPAAHASQPEKAPEPAKQKLTVDQMEKRITSTLEEYVEIIELNEVVETLKALPSRECYPFVIFKAVEMCCDVSKHKDCLVSQFVIRLPLRCSARALCCLCDVQSLKEYVTVWAYGCVLVCFVQVKLLGQMFENKVLSAKELEEGMGKFLQELEDIAIAVPSAPKTACEFLVHGIEDKYLSWAWVQGCVDKYSDKEKFFGTLLATLLSELGAKDAYLAWRKAGEAGVSIAGFGIKDESALIEQYKLDSLFPLVKLIPELLAGDMSDEEIIAEMEKTTRDLELTVDREISRMLVRCVLQKAVAELGGAEKLQKHEGEALIVAEEKAALQKRKALLKKWLDKECDQAFALFEVQKCAQEMGYPKGLSLNPNT